MKRLRLLIAKWALSAENIAPDDIAEACGIDVRKAVSDAASKEVERIVSDRAKGAVEKTLKELVTPELKELAPDVLQVLIATNTKLDADQKMRLLSVLDEKVPDFYA